MEQIFSLGLQGVMAFGIVGVVTKILSKKNIELDSDIKFYLLAGIALAVGFIPADLGSVIFNRLKDAVAVALALSTINTLRKSN